MHPRQPFLIEPILRRIAAGERQAYADVVRHFQGPLFGYLGRLGLSAHLADEIAQETFLRAWRSLAGYQPGKAAFSTWLFTIARHLAFDELNRQSRRPEEAIDGPLPEVASETPQPPQALSIRQTGDRVRRVLRRLSVADRAALALVHLDELSIDEAARLEGCTPGALKVRLHRARQRFRALLEQDDE